MNLKEIVAISGVSGLHKIIGRTKTGLILESLNETKKRFPTSIQDKVSVLDDISMYTLEGDMRLAEVFVKLNQTKNVPGPKEEPKTLRKFLVDIIQLDSERVYDSDIKKLLVWYHILQGVIDFSKLLQEEESMQETSAATEEVKAEEETEAPKKAAKKSAKKSDADDAEAAPKKPKTAARKIPKAE